MAEITFRGNVATDPELRYTPSGKAVINFNAAENHSKKDQSGQWVEDGATFYRVAVWGATAEALADSLRKGAPVVVAGRFRAGEFAGRDGQQVRTYEVTANHVGLIPRRDQQGAQSAQQGHQQQTVGYQQAPPQQGGTWGAPPQGQQDSWAGAPPQSERPPF